MVSGKTHGALEVIVFRAKFINRIVLAAAVAALGLSASVPSVFAADEKWTAQYFPNQTLSGEPLHTVTEKSINHDWKNGAPFADMEPGQFSARWTRNVQFNSTGTYRFTATMDDGMRVWLDGNKIIDGWSDSQVRSISADVYVAAGEHRLKVEYYEARGDAVARFDWVQLNAPHAAVEPSTGNWRGEYFNSVDLSGPAVLVRNEQNIAFSWGDGSPDSDKVRADNFSARWTRMIPFNAGNYEFKVAADDGVRLWVNGKLVIDQWRDQAETTAKVNVQLAAGSVPVVLEYYDRHGGAKVNLSWAQVAEGSAQTPNQPTTYGVWYAEYFNNKNLAGRPLVTRNESNLDFNWGYGSPVPDIVNVDDFSARWTATFTGLEASRYRFTVKSDDGVRVYLNDQIVIDNWTNHAVEINVADVNIKAGANKFQIEYYDARDLAEIQVSWKKIEGVPVVIEAEPMPLLPNQMIVTAGTLNVRSGAGVSNRVIGHVFYGDRVALLGGRAKTGSSTWVEVKTANGTTGWVNLHYLRIPKNSSVPA